MEVNSSYAIDNDHILWLINEETFKTDLPAFVFIFVCMILGIMGNSLTVYVYYFRMKRITQNIYITWLALFDLISCGTSIPYELFDLRFPLLYAEPVPCKLFRTLAFFTNMCSCILLLVIAFDRYRATHHVSKTTQTKLSITMTFLIAFLLSFPAPFVFGIKTVPTVYPNISGTACSFDGSVADTPFPTVYYTILGVVFFASFIILGIIYIKIGSTIYSWKHTQIGETEGSLHRKNSEGTLSVNSIEQESDSREDKNRYINGKDSLVSQTIEEDSVFTVEGKHTVIESVGNNTSCFKSILSLLPFKSSTVHSQVKLMKYSPNEHVKGVTTQKSKYEKYSRSISSASSGSRNLRTPKRSKSMKEKANIKRSNAVFASITFVFVLSYLPFLLLEILKQVGVISDDLNNRTEQSVFELFTKTMYLNNVINPFIYGILNSFFRDEIKNLFTGRIPKRRNSSSRR